MNQFQKRIQSKIDILVAESKSAEVIDHNSTKGSIRERLLIDFFQSLIPPKFDITSGIVCDAKGRSSKQTDFIVRDNSLFPPFLFATDVSVVPVDSVHLIAEIKTTLRSSDLKQVTEARTAFNELELATCDIPDESEIKIPSVILAFNNEVSQSTLEKWLIDRNDVVAICIIGDYSLSKAPNGVECQKEQEGKPKYWETLSFAIQLFDWLQKSSSTNRGKFQLWPYLQGVKKPFYRDRDTHR